MRIFSEREEKRSRLKSVGTPDFCRKCGKKHLVPGVIASNTGSRASTSFPYIRTSATMEREHLVSSTEWGWSIEDDGYRPRAHHNNRWRSSGESLLKLISRDCPREYVCAFSVAEKQVILFEGVHFFLRNIIHLIQLLLTFLSCFFYHSRSEMY